MIEREKERVSILHFLLTLESCHMKRAYQKSSLGFYLYLFIVWFLSILWFRDSYNGSQLPVAPSVESSGIR